MKKLLFITGGSEELGYGHIRRSLELKSILDEKFELNFYISVNKSFLYGNKYSCIEKPYVDDVCDGVLLDLPSKLGKESLMFFSKKNLPIVALGCFYEVNGKPDVAINLDSMGENIGESITVFEGLNYAIVRDEFSLNLTNFKKPNKIVLSIGGADTCNLTPLILKEFQKRNDKSFDLHVILGPMSSFRPEKNNAENFFFHIAPLEPAEIMADASIAICNGGTMMIEYAFLGVPIIAIPQSHHEEVFIRKFEHEGAAIFFKREDANNCVNTALELIDDTNKLSLMSSGKKLCDGKGKYRIMKIIEEVLNEFR